MKKKIDLVKKLLKNRKFRLEEQKFVVEGPHLVAEAQEFVEYILYSQDSSLLAKLKTQGLESFKVTKKQFAELSRVDTPQGILAVVKKPKISLKDMTRVINPLIVFCVGVQDPGNLGTIIRTADAVAASGIILSRGTVDLYNDKVIRASMGSMFHLPIVQIGSIVEIIAKLKQQQVNIVAAAGQASKSFFETDFKKATAIIIGNEGAGLPADILRLADEVVSIPMPGRSESLNVAVAGSIMLYEAVKQRKYAGKN